MTRARQAGSPVLVVAVALALWLISDRLVFIGPLDRATFGWAVVVPLWAVAPTFAGFAWRTLSASDRTQASILVGLAVGVAAVVMVWLSVTTPAIGCTPPHAPFDHALPALAVGAVIGGGLALACRLASGEVAAAHIGRGAIYGAVVQLMVIPLASLLFVAVFSGLCQRP